MRVNANDHIGENKYDFCFQQIASDTRMNKGFDYSASKKNEISIPLKPRFLASERPGVNESE